jgi:hypothetical protein
MKKFFVFGILYLLFVNLIFAGGESEPNGRGPAYIPPSDRPSGTGSYRPSAQRTQEIIDFLSEIEIVSPNYFEVALTSDYTGAVITGLKSSSISVLRIPETLQEFPVKEIGVGAFKSNTTITSVVLPSTIEKIGDEAFRDCRNLATVTIPEGITEIGNDAFSDCSALTSIALPSSVRKIGNNAFRNTGLTSITIASTERIEFGENAFQGTRLTLPFQAELRHLGYTGSF